MKLSDLKSKALDILGEGPSPGDLEYVFKAYLDSLEENKELHASGAMGEFDHDKAYKAWQAWADVQPNVTFAKEWLEGARWSHEQSSARIAELEQELREANAACVKVSRLAEIEIKKLEAEVERLKGKDVGEFDEDDPCSGRLPGQSIKTFKAGRRYEYHKSAARIAELQAEVELLNAEIRALK